MNDGYWVSDTALRGHLAMWVVRQHPYKTADGVDAVGEAITNAARQDAKFKGDDAWRAAKFADAYELDEWLTAAIGDHPQMTVWNTARSGNPQGFVAISRHGGPAPEHDFIDISALMRNVAHSAWDEARDDTEADRCAAGGPQ